MTPTFHFRWLIRARSVTRLMVEAERERSGDSFEKCKDRLIARQPPVLQQFWNAPDAPDAIDFEGMRGVWQDLPFAHEELPPYRP